MGRAPCCDKANVKKGPWSPEEDAKLKDYINKHGTGGNWITLPKKAGLRRCGKSCRLRWLNYLRPNIKHGQFSDAEDRIICNLFASIGSRWSIIAAQLPGRTDNDIKNYWNTKLKKKLMGLMNPLSQKNSYPQVYSDLSMSNFQSISPFLPSPYSCSMSFTNHLTMSIPSSPSTVFSNQQIPPVIQSQDDYANSMQNYQVKDEDSLLHAFESGRRDQAACCSSSDVKEVDYEYSALSTAYEYDDQSAGLQFQSDSCEKLNGNSRNADGYYGKTPLECCIEEIKQLISTDPTDYNLDFFVDRYKAEEQVMY